MPVTDEVCPRCKIGKLFGVHLKNSCGVYEGWRVECPFNNCMYVGIMCYVELSKPEINGGNLFD